MRIRRSAFPRRPQLALIAAALSGLLSGVARAVTDWALHR